MRYQAGYQQVRDRRAEPGHQVVAGIRAAAVGGDAVRLAFRQNGTPARLGPTHRSVEHSIGRVGRGDQNLGTSDHLVRLVDELRPLTLSLVGRKTKLVPKDEWATILGHSPDVADALIKSMILTP